MGLGAVPFDAPRTVTMLRSPVVVVHTASTFGALRGRVRR